VSARRGRHSRPDPGDSERIDALYGLEPVFEPGGTGPGGAESFSLQVQSVHCPYCGEAFETVLDTSAGSASYVEDCQICCQPIEFALEVDHAGALQSLSVLRSG